MGIEAYSNQVEIPGIASIIHEDVLNQATYGNHCELSATTILAVYNDVTNSKGMVRIGTRVSDFCIEWGTAVQFYNGLVKHIIPVRVSDTKFLLVYAHADDDDGYCIAGTVAGTVPTLGSEAEFADAVTCTPLGAVLMTTDKVMIAYQDATTNQKAVMASMSGTVVTVGTPATINSTIDSAAYTSLTQLCMHSATLASVVYRVSATVTEVVTLSLSGTTITPNTAGKAAFGGSADIRYSSIGALSATAFALAYTDVTDTNKGNAQIGTISGTTITAGASEYNFDSGSLPTRKPIIVAISSAHVAILSTTASTGTYIYIYSVSGTTMTSVNSQVLDYQINYGYVKYPTLSDSMRLTANSSGQLTFTSISTISGFLCGMASYAIASNYLKTEPMRFKIATAGTGEQIELSSIYLNACNTNGFEHEGAETYPSLYVNGTLSQNEFYSNGGADMFAPAGDYGSSSKFRHNTIPIIVPNSPVVILEGQSLYVSFKLRNEPLKKGNCSVFGLKRS